MFKEGYCEETGILQKESLSFFKAFDPRGVPQERSNLAAYGNRVVKSLVENFINNYLKEEGDKHHCPVACYEYKASKAESYKPK